MAFQSAAGHGNLPNGVFSPVIYSKQTQMAFRKGSVVEDITVNDYFGEIANLGDTVHIIKEPEITVKAYERGTQITAQDLTDDDFTLVVDKALYFAFKVDDIEEKHSHVNWQSLATDRAAYRMKDSYDEEVLGYLSGFKRTAAQGQHGLPGTARVAGDKSGTDPVTVAADGFLTSMILDEGDFGGSGGTEISISTDGTGTGVDASPLQIMNRMKRLLDQQQVPGEGRWFVADPVFWEVLEDENSKLADTRSNIGGDTVIRNGMQMGGQLRGFRCYNSVNLPSIGSGPGAATASSYGVLLAGHDSAAATANQLNKVESYRDPDSFADIVRGMNMYGRKILRPEALTRAIYRII
jgi:hypothetical protein